MNELGALVTHFFSLKAQGERKKRQISTPSLGVVEVKKRIAKVEIPLDTQRIIKLVRCT
jgi:hypothetical protein